MNPLIPNPNHETRQRGRSSARHARNTVYYKRSWLRVPHNRTRPTTVKRALHELSAPLLIHHLNTLYPDTPPEREVCSETVPRHLDLPLDLDRRIEAPESVDGELAALIESALASRPTRYRHESRLKDGKLVQVRVEIPHRPIVGIKDFLEAFPSMKEAVVRIVNLNQGTKA